jgi:hypothetical protein
MGRKRKEIVPPVLDEWTTREVQADAILYREVTAAFEKHRKAIDEIEAARWGDRASGAGADAERVGGDRNSEQSRSKHVETVNNDQASSYPLEDAPSDRVRQKEQ